MQAIVVERENAIVRSMARLRDLMQTCPLHLVLQQAEVEMAQLASHREWFTVEEFPGPHTGQSFCAYPLHCDPDGTLALELNVMIPEDAKPPHDHGTWAVFSAVEGAEHNVLYRLEPGKVPGSHKLAKYDEVIVHPGCTLSLFPDAIHCASALPGPSRRHLHLYGIARSLQVGAKAYDPLTGDARTRRSHATEEFHSALSSTRSQ